MERWFMLRQFTVAAVQFSPELKEKANNINKLYQMAMDAAEKGAKLIVLPEMATTGYCFLDRHEIQGYVEQVPGRTTDIFGEIARKYGCYLVVGIAEVDPVTDNYYNTAVLIGPLRAIHIPNRIQVDAIHGLHPDATRIPAASTILVIELA
jgi:predicted amidohydrolase